MASIEVELVADKVTKGSVRFMEEDTGLQDFLLNVYLRKERVQELGLEPVVGQRLTMTLAVG